MHDLPVDGRFVDRGRCRRGVRPGGQTDNVDVVDPRGLVDCRALIEREPTVAHRHLLGGGEKIVGRQRHGVPIVEALDVERVGTAVRRIADRDGHLVQAVGERKFPILPHFKMDQRVQALIRRDAAVAGLIGVVARPAVRQTATADAEDLAGVRQVSVRYGAARKLKVDQVRVARQKNPRFE